MNLMHLVGEYIAKHSRNIGVDVVQHLRAFATHAEAKTADWFAGLEDTGLKIERKAEGTYWKLVDTVKEEVKAVEADVQVEAHAVESAVHELETHAVGAFEHLLHAQHPETETAPKEQE